MFSNVWYPLERSLPKSDLIKINLSEACEQIVAGEPGRLGAPPPTPSPSSSDLSSAESSDAEGDGKRKKRSKSKKKKDAKKKIKRRAQHDQDEGERVVIGLRLSANLMLGVCRVYDAQVTHTSTDATHLFLALRPMLNEYMKGGKAGIVGGPRRLDMPDDAGARANTSNLDAPEENMLGFGLDFGMAEGFGGEEWDNFEFDPISSVGKATTLSQSTRTGENDDEDDDDDLPRARARASGKQSTLGSPSRINVHEPYVFGSDRASQGADFAVDFEPGVDLGLGLLEGDEMMDEDGGASGWGERPGGSSSAGGLGMAMDDGYQYFDDGAGFNFGDDDGGQPMGGIDPGMRPIQKSYADDETNSTPISILRTSGERGKRKQSVKLAKMDNDLTYPDSEIKSWRKDYVKKMIDQGNAAKEKQVEKNAKDGAVKLLQEIPAIVGVHAPELVSFILGQQNQKRSFVKTPKPRTKRRKKKNALGADTGSETEDEDIQQQQEGFYPDDDNNNFDMGDVQPMGVDEHQERYVDYSIPVRYNDTTRQSEGDDDESEVGRKGGSSRKSSSAPWDSVQRRGRESSVGLLGDTFGGLGSSSYGGRFSTTGRPSLAADSVLAARRQRAGSRLSSHRSGSIDRMLRPGSAQRGGTDDGMGGALDDAYPQGEMLQDEGYLQEGDEVVETFSLERQSYIFLEYLKKMIADLPQPSPVLNDDGEDEAEPLLTIDFSVLVPVESCTPSAGAKGFYQCLVLCTKDIIALSQEEEFGEIKVRLK